MIMSPFLSNTENFGCLQPLPKERHRARVDLGRRFTTHIIPANAGQIISTFPVVFQDFRHDPFGTPPTPRMKLSLIGTVNRLNVEHRTLNIERPILMVS